MWFNLYAHFLFKWGNYDFNEVTCPGSYHSVAELGSNPRVATSAPTPLHYALHCLAGFQLELLYFIKQVLRREVNTESDIQRVVQWSETPALRSDRLASNPIPTIYDLLLLSLCNLFCNASLYTSFLGTHLSCNSYLILNALMGTGFLHMPSYLKLKTILKVLLSQVMKNEACRG